jgi:hypothetical protein
MQHLWSNYRRAIFTALVSIPIGSGLVGACRAPEVVPDRPVCAPTVTTEELIAAAKAQLPTRLFPPEYKTMTADVEHHHWRRYLERLHGWEVVNASASLSQIVSGGNYAVLYVQAVSGLVIEDGTAFVVIDLRDTSHIVSVADREMTDPKQGILYEWPHE